MAQFKVGDRVKFVSVRDNNGQIPVGAYEILGREGVITKRGEPIDCWDWYVYVPGCPAPVMHGDDLQGDTVFADSCMLAPLTDPRADQFIEDMERFARVVPRERVTLVQGDQIVFWP